MRAPAPGPALAEAGLAEVTRNHGEEDPPGGWKAVGGGGWEEAASAHCGEDREEEAQEAPSAGATPACSSGVRGSGRGSGPAATDDPDSSPARSQTSKDN